jgi:hypothetical protein
MRGWSICIAAIWLTWLSSYLAAPRLATVPQGIGVSLGMGVAGLAVTAARWPGRAEFWRGHRAGLAAAATLLLVATGLAIAFDDLEIGLRGLTM